MIYMDQIDSFNGYKFMKPLHKRHIVVTLGIMFSIYEIKTY